LTRGIGILLKSYLQPEIMHDEQESEKNIAQQLDHLFNVLTD
jgi:hypothetical protein